MSYIYEYLLFNEKNCLDYGVRISGSETFNKPKRSTETVTIPGRNGTLEIDNRRYENVDINYSAFIVDKFSANFDGFIAYMMSQRGYKRLEDTYHPDYYRLAKYIGGISPKMSTRNKAGSFTISFDCKPQCFLKEGERTIEVKDGQTIHNMTLYEAKPLIRVYGVGSLYINDIGIIVTEANEYTDIDCEIQEAFDNVGSRNRYIKNVNSYDFPILAAGINEINYTGFSKVEITPRWWTL